VLRRARAAAQLLHRPAVGGPAAVVAHLLAVQAQDLRAARLALRARIAGLCAADVDAALTDERSLVVAWLGRGTLHLVGRDDYPWLLALTARGSNARWLAEEGISPDDAERAVAIVERALADDGPLTRAQLAERIGARGIRTEGQATPHLLYLAARRGIAVLGPVRPEGHAFALVRDWLGEPPPIDRDAALAELARRYLRGHGPATAADLAGWAGVPLREARAGLAAIAAELVERGDLVDLAARGAEVGGGARAATPAAAIPPRLLGAFDPYLLGWKDRTFAVPAEHARRVHPGGGMVRATATGDGRVVGTWTLRRGEVELELFARAAKRAFQEETADVASFLTNARPS
jgi:hypothetical protein